MKNIALIGMTGVGKTTFTLALATLGKKFATVPETLPTLYFEKYKVRIGNITLSVIDTPGHLLTSPSDFKKIFKKIKDVDFVLFFADITRDETFSSRLFEGLAKFIHPAKVIVVINKMDLVNYDLSITNKVLSELKKANFKPARIIPISAKTTYNIYIVIKTLAELLQIRLPVIFPILAIRVMEDDNIIAEFTRKELPNEILEFIRRAVSARDERVGLDLISAFWSAVRKILSTYSKRLGDNFMIETEIGKVAIITKEFREKELMGLFILSSEIVSPFIAIRPKLEEILINVYTKRERGEIPPILNENDVIKIIISGVR